MRMMNGMERISLRKFLRARISVLLSVASTALRQKLHMKPDVSEA